MVKGNGTEVDLDCFKMILKVMQEFCGQLFEQMTKWKAENQL